MGCQLFWLVPKKVFPKWIFHWFVEFHCCFDCLSNVWNICIRWLVNNQIRLWGCATGPRDNDIQIARCQGMPYNAMTWNTSQWRWFRRVLVLRRPRWRPQPHQRLRHGSWQRCHCHPLEWTLRRHQTFCRKRILKTWNTIFNFWWCWTCSSKGRRWRRQRRWWRGSRRRPRSRSPPQRAAPWQGGRGVKSGKQFFSQLIKSV